VLIKRKYRCSYSGQSCRQRAKPSAGSPRVRVGVWQIGHRRGQGDRMGAVVVAASSDAPNFCSSYANVLVSLISSGLLASLERGLGVQVDGDGLAVPIVLQGALG